ncbi:MAG: nucleotidyltransferase domain-containing protein [Acidobacteria bacterium]|nr:nucleotidyltransferase domain-containing protein [Acidobacteriota bacterium]
MDKTTTEIASKFAAQIRKVYSPEKIILFGSRARGDNFKSSDFDFIVVSDKFRETRFVERPAELYDYWNESVDIEALCYTPAEFARKLKQHGIVRAAVREGVEL